LENKLVTNQPLSIGDYLIAKIAHCGVSHVFGIPGDYILSFYSKLDASSLKVINTCDEQGAGFAADAYGRLNGLGVVCVTYNVGGLKLVNSTAQAYAQKVPILVVAGAPVMSPPNNMSLPNKDGYYGNSTFL